MTTTVDPPKTRAPEPRPPSKPPRASGRAPKRLHGNQNRAGYTFLLPWLVGFILLTVGPMAASLYLSFTSYNLFQPPQWIGWGNYAQLFNDPKFLQSSQVTLVYVLVGTPIKLAAALAVAMLLNNARRGQSFYRSAFYVPSLIGASVSIAIVWRAMFIDDGIVERITSAMGLDWGGWVGNPDFTMSMFILLATWQFGAPMVIFLAGLKNVPRELYEAAEVDGAGPWRRFWSITLPMLSPVLFFNLLLETINAFQVFASAYIISDGTGGPAGSSLFYTLYMYQRGFEDLRMGYASAMAWVLLIVVGIITLIFFRTSKAWVHYGGDTK
ncbi:MULTISPECIES: carbohydrate ABC transporter permease [unclassified Pseudoclavibacter]|uniref:carbohydrate ABC transporter permease n=1 Tax=unclassified Pseudoclavibacter TaxID=2615177 RepID=UPI001BA5CC85|nr:sugar ABC transporter permease [Pseudoclavibacter sp. Marseille-Q4354]MBS3179863.1 sugar ABC transporter permease [Pseudoclavibacter sp. Marseille-Q4354]